MNNLSDKQKCIKPTQDDWYSNDIINGQKVVIVSCLGLITNDYRVCVWGNDDYGLEKDYSSRGEAIQIYRQIKRWKFVNKQNLKDIGFNNA